MMARVLVLVSCVVASTTWAAPPKPCATPPARDTAALATAVAQDKVVANAFEKTATICGERGPECDRSRLECTALVNSIVQKQVGFDEGVWLRDMLLPYLGQQYPMTRTFGPLELASDASCNVDVAKLNAAALRRTKQAARRELLLQEYQLFLKWTQDALQRCQARVAIEETRSAEAKAESERVAATAAAAAAAAEAQRKAEEEAKRRAEEQARAQREAQEAAKRKAEDQARAQQKAQEEAQRKAEEQARAQQKAQEEAQRQAEARQREQEQAKREADEARTVAQREAQKESARKQKAELLAQAEAEEEAARQTAAQKAEGLRKKAAGIEVNDEDERARGNVSIMGVAGVLTGWAGSVDTTSAFALGAGLAAHLGFWGTAPADGMASGFEVRLSGRFLQTLTGTSANSLEGVLTGRYFFGRFGVGGAGALRLFDAFRSLSFDAGASLAVAFVDTPRTRVLLSAHWVPVGTSMDLTRFFADFEVSYQLFTVHFHGGVLTQNINMQSSLAWEAGVALGARLGW